MKKSDFYYDLPERLIAQTPIERRDDSRLLVLNKQSGALEHRRFYNITEYLRAGDCLVLNETRVIPARLLGEKRQTGGTVEVLLLKDLGGDRWECIVRPGRRLKAGSEVSFGGRLLGTITDVLAQGNRVIEFCYNGIFYELLNEIGTMPLPHYIKERLDDGERYQTVYARERGSAAAPTAGLHFTPELLRTVEGMGVDIVKLTLHVGLGTFRPVKAERIEDHVMHSESYSISADAAARINAAKVRGGRVIAVGTTSCRALESAADERGEVRPGGGGTDIFIYPGYKFKVPGGLITNFHLPESTLVMLVSALAGRERVLAAYREAVELEYRFFSFGDAMLIV